MGVTVIVGGFTSTDTTAPILNYDSRLNAGSLILTDFTHSLTASGVPASGDPVANIAFNEAAALIGSGTEATLASSFLSNARLAPYGDFERTANGALYGVVSDTDQGAFQGRIEGSSLVRDYVVANPARDYAVFMWTDIKRVAASTTNLYTAGIGDTASFASNRLFLNALSNSLGQGRRAANSPTGWIGSPNGTPTLNRIYVAAWGNIPPYNSLNANSGQSFILYQYHLIDVAASGMTYAELDALDAAAYTQFFSEGGRGYNDSVTLDLGDYT